MAILKENPSKQTVLLAGVAEAAQKLLTIADFDTAIDGALKALAGATKCDRISIYRHQVDFETQREFADFSYGWGIAEERSNLPKQLFYDEIPGYSHWWAELKAGQAVQPLAREMPHGWQALSVLIMPIFIEDYYWGSISFDNCTRKQVWSDAEIAVLETATACIGGAIDRDVTCKKREAAAKARAEELLQVNNILKNSFNRLTNEPDLNVFLGYVIDSVNQAVGAAKGHVFLYDADANTLELQLSVQQGTVYIGATAGEPELFYAAFPADITPAYLEMCQSDEIILLSVIQETSDMWPGTLDWHRRCGHTEAAVVTLRSGNRPIGMLGLCFTEPVTITEEQKALMNALADQAAVAIDLSRLAEENKMAAVVQEREAAERSILQERERAAQERAAELGEANRAISQTLSTLASKPQLSEFLGQLLLAIAQKIGACKVHLFLYDPASHTLNLHTNIEDGHVYAGATTSDIELFHQPIPADITPAWRLTSESEAILMNDLRSPLPDEIWWPGTQEWHRTQGHVSWACMPMRAGDQALGFIGFAFRDRAVLTDEQLEFMQALTNQAIVAIQLTRLAEDAKQTAILQEQEKAAQARAAQLTRSNQALKSSLDSLAQQPELDAFLQRVVDEAATQTGAASGHLFLSDQAANTCWLQVSTDNNGDWRTVSDMALWLQPVSINEAPAFWELILKKEPVIVENLQATLKPGPHIWEPSIDWHLQRNHSSFICVPLVLGDRVLGFLGLPFIGSNTISQDEVELAQALANQATLAIQLTRLAEEAKQTAILQEQERAAQERVFDLAKTNEAIAKSLTNLAANPELDPFLGTIIAEMARQLKAGKVQLFLYDQLTDTLTQRVVVQDGQVFLGTGPNGTGPNGTGPNGTGPNGTDRLKQLDPADITPGWQAILNSDRPLIYDETLPFDEAVWWPETVAWHQAQGHKAVTCIPMKAWDTSIGYISFCFYDRTILTDEQLEFMQALANQAIVALQLTHLAEEAKQTAILQEKEKAAQERAAELAKTNEAIAQTLNALTTTPQLNEFLGQILTQIIEQIGADDTHLFLYDAETHTLRSQLAVQNSTVYIGNAPGDPELFHSDIPADITNAWQILVDAPRPVTLDENHPEAAEFFWPTTPEWHASRGHQSATCACMKIGHQPVGFIGFAFCDRTILTNEQLEFIQALTNQATLAIHLTRLAEQARTNALTDERTRLAREIHDTLAQAFTGVSLQLEAAKGVLTRQPEQARLYIDQAGNLARRGLSEARRSVRALRSQALETETLPNAIKIAVHEMTQSSSLEAEFHLVGTPVALPEDVQTNLLRIGQEAITNVLRHAQAQHLKVILRFTPQRIHLTVIDDGQGCRIKSLADTEGFGLLGMRERALRFGGKFHFNSLPGTGTTIEAIISLTEIGPGTVLP